MDDPSNFDRLVERQIIVIDPEDPPSQAFKDRINGLSTAEVDAMIAVNQILISSQARGRVQVGQCGTGNIPAGGF